MLIDWQLGEIERLSSDNAYLLDALSAQKEDTDPGTLIYESTGLVMPARESALLDIALDVISGRISGIDADRLSALR